MLKFPQKNNKKLKSYAEEYLNILSKVSKRINFSLVNDLSDLLSNYYSSDRNILSAEMRSAAISNHFICDHLKSILILNYYQK